MNLVAISGRLTRDPDYRMSQNGEVTNELARFILAVNRDGKDAGADFISCIAFNNTAHFVQQYFQKGMKMELEGRIQTGSYKDRNGQTVYTTDVVASRVRFAESKTDSQKDAAEDAPIGSGEFVNVGADVQAELPFL